MTTSRTSIAPARVNLIGEHTDYTGGYVLPMAISFFTQATISANDRSEYAFSSDRFKSERKIALADRSGKAGDWSDYPIGVLRELQRRNVAVPPFRLHITGNVPLGAGLSSSASVEVASALALLAHAQEAVLPKDVAILCRRAENDFVGSPCGIMDQFVVTAAQAEYAMLLNTGDLSHEFVPLNIGRMAGYQIVVVNSMVKHSIGDGEYGTRRRQVEEGQQELRKTFPDVGDLGDATLDQLANVQQRISDKAFLRCRHIISENKRVLESALALKEGDAHRLGELMTQAHGSQRDDFECSCAEIDSLVETAISFAGCVGARMTGGGFGGCTVNLVEGEKINCFTSLVVNTYRKRFGFNAEIYVCDAVDGAVRLRSAGAN